MLWRAELRVCSVYSLSSLSFAAVGLLALLCGRATYLEGALLSLTGLTSFQADVTFLGIDHAWRTADTALAVGLVVDAVDERDLALRGLLRDRLVGEQHELLDEPVGRLPLLLVHVHRLALGVQLHADLGHVEVDGALGHPLGRERLGEVARTADVVGELGEFGREEAFLRVE